MLEAPPHAPLAFTLGAYVGALDAGSQAQIIDGPGDPKITLRSGRIYLKPSGDGRGPALEAPGSAAELRSAEVEVTVEPGGQPASYIIYAGTVSVRADPSFPAIMSAVRDWPKEE